MKEPQEDILELLGKSAEPLQGALHELALAAAITSRGRRREGIAHLGELLGSFLGLSDLLGRHRLELSAKGRTKQSLRARTPEEVNLFYAGGPIQFASQSLLVPEIEFGQAIADISSRTPELARSWEEVSKVYRRHGLALSRATDLKITTRVAEILQDLHKKGADLATNARKLALVGAGIVGWTKAYSDNVLRTNANLAYTAGRFRHAIDPAVSKVIGALEFNATGDSLTRRGRVKEDKKENHLAADGIIAHPRDKVWLYFSSPLGYQCRCGLREVDRWELKERRLLNGDQVKTWLPPTFGDIVKTPGFGQRPDLAIYGGR